ncbi:MAG: pyrroline-5-carboxylate reductase [Turicibacter sp.]
MHKKIGFIGFGNMAYAMAKGLVNSEFIKPCQLVIYDVLAECVTRGTKMGLMSANTPVEVVKMCDYIVVAVKPNQYDEVLENIKLELDDQKVVITIAAGKSIQQVTNVIGCNKKIVRTMPNTPALVNEAMSAICPNSLVHAEELTFVKKMFESFGKAEVVSEYLIDAVIGVSGSSPAYVFMLIEAMGDGAVLGGMSRELAYQFAAQAVLGSAKMVLESGIHPGVLKDRVCSPGGTTIEAVKVLEDKGLRSAIMCAMDACMDKSKKM